MTAIEEEVRAKLITLCSDFLSGQWKAVDVKSVKITKFANGYANRNYRCTLPDVANQKETDTPTDVVVHLYGSIEGKQSSVKFKGEATEAVILEIFSKLDWAPKLVGIFEGGRIDEYIPSWNPKFADLKAPGLIEAIGTQLARIHCTNIPVSKTVNRVPELIDRMEVIDETKFTEEKRELYKEFCEFPLVDEFLWFDKHSSKFGAKPVFCHNDITLNNILVRENPPNDNNKVMIIDFETSSYYYRAFDLAYFLMMRTWEYGIKDGKSYRKILVDENEEETRRRLLESYLKEWHLRAKNIDPVCDTLEHLQMEVDYFTIHCHLYTFWLVRGYFGSFEAIQVMTPEEFRPWIDITKNDYLASKELVLKKYSDKFEQMES